MTTVKGRPCSACHSSVYDLEHVRTRRDAVIDVRPDPKGNILVNLEEGFYTVLRKEVLDALTPEERTKLHTSHFMTCRYASEFRNGRRPNANQTRSASS